MSESAHRNCLRVAEPWYHGPVSDPLLEDLQSLRIDRGDPPPRRSSKAAPRPSTNSGAGPSAAWAWLGRVFQLAAVLGLIAAAALWGYPALAARVFKTEVRVGEVARVSPVQATTAVTATGYVVALTSARVTPRLPGRVSRARVREGDHVDEGQVLFELDAADQRSALAAALARAAAAEARVAVARANLSEAQVQLSRQRSLVAQGASPRSGLEDLEARMEPMRASVAAAQAEVRSLRADAEVIRANLATLVVRAPFAGTVLNRAPLPGEVVGPEVRFLELADLSSQVVEVDVPEARLSLVRVGGPCELSLDAFPGRRLRGAVQEIGHRVDRAKATVPVRVRFVDGLEGVLPEMSARVSFLTEEVSAEALRDQGRVVVPSAAVVERGGRRVVFVVEDGVAHERAVRTGEAAGDALTLLEGPEVGARVVLRPPTTLREGNPVKEVAR